MLKALWETKLCTGTLPDSRESCAMVSLGNEIYMYGGYGRELFDDVRLL